MAKSKRNTSKSTKKPQAVVATETRTRRVEPEQGDNKSLVRKIVIIVLLLVGIYLVLNAISGWRNDQGEKTPESSETSQTEESEQADEVAPEAEANGTITQETDEAFTFVVGQGESYTTMARRAVASVDSDMTVAERVAAETKLTTDANAEWLNEGQDLSLDKETVRAAVDWAKNLTDEQKAAWQPYADLVAW